MSSPFAVLVGGDAVVVFGCLLLGGIFLLSGLASFLEVRVLVGLFLLILFILSNPSTPWFFFGGPFELDSFTN